MRRATLFLVSAIVATHAFAKVAMWPEEAPEPVVILKSTVDVEKATADGGGVAVDVGAGIAVGGGRTEFTPSSHRYWIKAKNVSHKVIKAIEFAVDFYSPFDELYATELIQVTTGGVKPKAWRELSVETEGVRHKQDDWHHKMRLRRVLFEDGTQWMSPDADAPKR